MDRRTLRGKILSAGFMLAGAGLLLGTSVLDWYSSSIANGMDDANEAFSPFDVRISGDAGGYVYNELTTFSDVYLSHTGLLYLAVGGVVVGGALVGFLGGALILRDLRRARRPITSHLVFAAVVLAATGPTLLFVAQPAILCTDGPPISSGSGSSVYGNSTAWSQCLWSMPLWTGSNSEFAFFSDSSPGPQTSFFGSTPFEVQGSQGYSHEWGPSIGWYLAVLATIVLVLGALKYRSATRAAGPGPDNVESKPGTGKSASGRRKRE